MSPRRKPGSYFFEDSGFRRNDIYEKEGEAHVRPKQFC